MPSLSHKSRTDAEYCCQTLLDLQEHQRRQAQVAHKNFIRRKPTPFTQAIFNIITILFAGVVIWKVFFEKL